MAYSDFKLEQVVEQFSLVPKSAELFSNCEPVELSSWLKETLGYTKHLALLSSTEKARSEFIVAPLLIELQRRHHNELSVFSGKRLDVDKESGLVGECDFLLSRTAMTNVIQAPVFSLVEAKKQDLELGLGQCVAQMLGAQLFNRQRGKDIPIIYGCVTTAESWQFLQLEDKTLTIDSRIYYFTELDAVLGIFEAIFSLVPAIA